MNRPLLGIRITLAALLIVFLWRVFEAWSSHSVLTLADSLLITLVGACAALLALILAVAEGR